MTSQDMSHATAPDPEYVALYRRLRATGGVELREQLHTRYLQLNRGAATPAGLPYPDPTDPVAEGASAIRALAEALDPHVADTGWVNIAVNSGYARQGSTDPQVLRIGHLVIARWGWANTGLTVGTDHTVGVVPVGFRPAVEAHTVPAVQTAAAQAAGTRMVFLVNGNVQIRVGSVLPGYAMAAGAIWSTS